MTWTTGLLLSAAIAAAFFAGLSIGAVRRRTRLDRIGAGVRQLAGGNLAHRILLPGDDEVAHIADSLNSLADGIQQEREASDARDAAQRRLLANISHDLRTPVASIAGYTDALRRGLSDEPERLLGVIAAKADDLAQLTDDLFYAARIDAGDLALRRDPVDLAEAVRRSALGFEPQLTSAGAVVGVTVPDERCMVTADPSAVNRILSNLISNSIRHSAGATSLSIEMGAEGCSYQVSVSNDGPRLPDDVQRLFERGVAGVPPEARALASRSRANSRSGWAAR